MYFALTIGSNGIPALRHDWYWPRGFAWGDDVFIASISGWQTQGIGGPNPFVNNYLLAAFLVPLEAVFGAYGALLLFLFAVALAIALSARKLAIEFGASVPLAITSAVFALFNPWTYTQIIAGHGAMLVAYAATMALVAEVLRAEPRPAVCAAAAAFTLPQLQFFVPAFIVVVALAIAKRRWLPLATWVIAGAANAVGVIFASHSLAGIPVTAAWEQTQSLAAVKALLLSGYFARYADGYDRIGRYAVACIALVALAGLLLGGRSRRVAVAAAATVAALIVAMGVNGPLAAVFLRVVERLPAVGLYRELYDVIGFAVIGYIALSAVASARRSSLSIAFAGATMVLFLLWGWHSPTRFWIDRRSLPTIDVSAAPNTRIALLPAFQPLQYRGAYSGLDPDAYPRGQGVTAINEAVPTWPADAALARFVQRGDAGALAALSVSQIANRPWYSTPAREFAEQVALPVRAQPPQLDIAFVAPITAAPMLSIIRMPPVVSIADRVGAGALFFGSAPGFTPPHTVRPPRRYVHASDGWVDVRLAFATDPDLAQPFGGALTTASGSPLALPGGAMLLAYVRGELRTTDGRALTRTTNGYHWIPVPAGVDAVVCHGLCALALQGSVPAGLAENASPPASQAIELSTHVPFIVDATLPAGAAAALRYNVRFDEQWTCAGCPDQTMHVPLDATVNGWLLPARPRPLSVMLIERLALTQAIGQAIGLLWIFLVLILAAREVRGPRLRTAA